MDIGWGGKPEAALGRAVILGEGEAMAQAARAAGLDIAERLSLADATAGLDELLHADVILLEAEGADAAALAALLPRLVARARADGARIVAAFAREQIDLVAAALLGTPAELLCDPVPAERVAACVAAAMRAPGVVREEGDGARAAELRRMGERLAEIAAALSRNGERGDDAVADRRRGYAPPPAPPEAGAAIDPLLIRNAIRARRMREQFFEPALFADPAWDMLLDLFAAQLEGADVSVSSLCIAAAVPPTTGLRWIATMTDAGLLDRRDDPRDRRRAHMLLTASASAGMARYLDALDRAGLAIA